MSGLLKIILRLYAHQVNKEIHLILEWSWKWVLPNKLILVSWLSIEQPGNTSRPWWGSMAQLGSNVCMEACHS